jgi:hypothetical protein
MLALGDEVELAVLADTEIAQRAQRGHGELRMDCKLVCGCPGRPFCQPRPDLLANSRQQLQEAVLKGLREELDPLEGRLGHSSRIFARESRMVRANRSDVCLTAHIRQRQGDRLERTSCGRRDSAN